MSKKASTPIGFNPNANGKTFWPSYKYKTDGSSRLFETEEEFKLEGEGWYERPGAAAAAEEKPKNKAPKAGPKGDKFDRAEAIAKLTKAGYTVTDDTPDAELKEAIGALKE